MSRLIPTGGGGSYFRLERHRERHLRLYAKDRKRRSGASYRGVVVNKATKLREVPVLKSKCNVFAEANVMDEQREKLFNKPTEPSTRFATLCV
jgi:hypothetical protein